MLQTNCINCNTLLKGSYCHTCGEKTVSGKDFTVRNLLEQSVDVFTHLDSKLFATLKTLLIKPGMLSVHYVQGLRKPFMKPVQVFLLANILFFFLLSDIDVFRIPAEWLFIDKPWGYDVGEIVRQKMIKMQGSENEIAIIYNQRSGTFAKSFVILFIPILALVFGLVFFGKKLQAGKHIIFATHIFSFFLILLVLWTKIIDLIPGKQGSNWYKIPSIILLAIYFISAIRNFYKVTWLYSIVATAVAITILILCIEWYRVAISIYSLRTLR